MVTEAAYLNQLSELLRSLGIGRQYLGHNITLQAIKLLLQDDSRITCLKRGVYQPLSARQQCDWRNIERNIRTVIHRAWCVNADQLTIMAGHKLHQAPSVMEFLEMLYTYIITQHPQ